MMFLIDAQLPPGLAHALRNAGHKAAHVFEIGLGNASDLEIAEAARGRNAILVSKDRDFHEMHMSGSLGTRLLWIRLGNVTNDALALTINRHLPTIVEAFNAGEIVIQVR